ncbi:hypothetical protein Syun_028236 [Stephania yunnanensis]|uniref:Uncharacterized protein n=1 Tax=Stephania yunnanensis TaxID=152371 RepID=A0AAP0EGZ5_9MAGN
MNVFHKKIIEEHMKVRTYQNGDEKCEMNFLDILLSLPGEDGNGHMDDVETKALIQPYPLLCAGHDRSCDEHVSSDQQVGHDGGDQASMCPPLNPRGTQRGGGPILDGHRIRLAPPKVPTVRGLEDILNAPGGPILIPHKSTGPTKINGYHISGGTRVFINTHGLGRTATFGKMWTSFVRRGTLSRQ